MMFDLALLNELLHKLPWVQVVPKPGFIAEYFPMDRPL